MGRLTIPYVPVNGASNLIDATSVNLNFNTIATAVNNVDNTQIGTLGIYANQVIPTNTSQATFGSSQTYTFPSNVYSTSGNFQALAPGSTTSGFQVVGTNVASVFAEFPNQSSNGSSTHATYFGANSSVMVAAVNGGVFYLYDLGNNAMLAMDGNGNAGFAGSIYATGFTASSNINTNAGVFSGNNSTRGTAGYFSGSGAPSFSAPNGSLYIRYDGDVGSRLYVNGSGPSTSGTTWNAVAGV
jgi:hypothetical protein